MNIEHKLLFLHALKARKEILFGKFSNEVSRERKVNAWKEIVNVLTAHDVPMAREKPFSYFRDTVWPNMRRYTVDKKDRRETSGADGGKPAKWTSVDMLVLDIIGRDSPNMDGLPGHETQFDSTRDPAATVDSAVRQESTLSVSSAPDSRQTLAEVIPITPTTSGSTEAAIKQPRKRPATSAEYTEKFRERKLKKLDLEIENLELRNALLRIETERARESSSVCTEGDCSYRNL